MNEKARIALSNPRFALVLAARKLNRNYHYLVERERVRSRGVDVLAEDWDNLVLLDACRYDAFERYHDLPGDLQSRYSRGAMTREFLSANFGNRRLHDTVYVTANPMFYRHRDELGTSFHATVDVWRDDGWDEQHRTVLPETTTEYAKRAAERFPNKRLIVHYIQPHFPFIGTDLDLGARVPDSNREAGNIWGDIMARRVDISDVALRRAYIENLRRVLPHVRNLLDSLPGRTVVTSDHGNILGERAFPIPIKEYGHPVGIYTEESLAVPWLTYNNGDRKRITAGDSTIRPEDDDGTVRDRLRELGYVS